MSAEADPGDLFIPHGTFESVEWERFLILRIVKACNSFNNSTASCSIIGQAVLFSQISKECDRAATSGFHVSFNVSLEMDISDFIDTCVQAIVPADVNVYAWAIRCAGFKLCKYGRYYSQVSSTNSKETADTYDWS